uniref:Uncharacterized protein n=1 Tax=Parascaris equorum TaxID=6256 RepID=A0A914RAG0_PAREQ
MIASASVLFLQTLIVMSSANVSASTIRIRMQAKREHERALAQDPSIFDYDGNGWGEYPAAFIEAFETSY